MTNNQEFSGLKMPVEIFKRLKNNKLSGSLGLLRPGKHIFKIKAILDLIAKPTTAARESGSDDLWGRVKLKVESVGDSQIVSNNEYFVAWSNSFLDVKHPLGKFCKYDDVNGLEIAEQANTSGLYLIAYAEKVQGSQWGGGYEEFTYEKQEIEEPEPEVAKTKKSKQKPQVEKV